MAAISNGKNKRYDLENVFKVITLNSIQIKSYKTFFQHHTSNNKIKDDTHDIEDKGD